MILVAGLTPAWQQIVELDSFQWGQVHRARRVSGCASGKAPNVAVALKHLGAEVELLSPRGGALGSCLQADLESLGVVCHWIETAAPTRVCTTLLLSGAADPAARSAEATELVENAQAFSDYELQAFRRAFAERAKCADYVVLTGSLPAGAPPDYYATLMQSVPRPTVLDVRGRELLAALPLRPKLVKPNEHELKATYADLVGSAVVETGARRLLDGGAEEVFVSAGLAPGSWFGPAGTRAAVSSLKVETVNPIGCGDCWTAGLVWAWTEGKSGAEALQLAAAAAADNARRLLPARLDPQWVRSQAGSVEVRNR